MNNRLFYIGLLAAIVMGCKPYTKSDLYEAKANPEKDELLHEKNSLEWWYFTGHLNEVNGDRTFGVEYVFFHTTPLGGKDYTLMNMALTDPQSQTFYYDYEINRRKKRMRTESQINLYTPNDGDSCFLSGELGSYNIQGKMKNHPIAYTLTTTPKKTVLLNDEIGYEKYGELAEAGYYSYTRLATTGTIEYKGESIPVEGTLWYDRQWNCGDVYGGRVSWDWMALQLDNGDDIMVYQITTPRIEGNKIYGGTYFPADESQKELTNENLQLTPTRFWSSEKTGVSYPIDWEVTLPEQEINLSVKAMVDEQELTFRFGAYTMKYWEGMCRVEGTKEGIPITGNAYVEMTNRRVANKVESKMEAPLLTHN